MARETYGNWERRAPLIPDHVRELTENGYKVIVQPSNRRVFPDSQYRAAGAEVRNDLSDASVILGVKQVPVPNLMENQTYMFFSHTMKAQEQNMPLLDACIAKNVTLFDYECILNPDNAKRMVGFGEYAGIVGLVDMLQGLGQRLLADGFSTPFLDISACYTKKSLTEVEEMVVSMGLKLKDEGLSEFLDPIVFSFTGDGNVGKGAKKMFELLPVTMVDPSELPALMEKEKGKRQHTVYGCYLGPEHLARRKDGGAFNKEEYYKNPSLYEGSFHDTIAPYTTAVVNGKYWDARFPRLLTTSQMRNLSMNGRPRIRAIADIPCDLEGSLEFCGKLTTLENPFYEWDAMTGKNRNVGDSNRGVAIMSMDTPATALSRDASKHFGDNLMPILKNLLTAQSMGLPHTPLLTPAMITHRKELCGHYQYIQQFREERERLSSDISQQRENKPHRVLLLQGHLFDSMFTNTALDMVSKKGNFEILDFIVMNTVSAQRESQLILDVTADSDDVLAEIIKEITSLGSVLEVRVQELDKDVHLHVDTAKMPEKPPRKVLLLGSGMVAAPVVDYLTKSEDRVVTIVSDSLEAAQALTARSPKLTSAVELSVEPMDAANAEWCAHLDELIQENDVVISLLPPPFHPSIARRCIRSKTHLVTASYVSPEMATMHTEAKRNGVVILNEMGLDPGIDHMSAMKLIHEAKETGGVVTSFSSVCGGLSSPDALLPDNPLQYSFSWSPAGVMSAALTPAKYLRDGTVVEIDGSRKLYDAEPFKGWPSLNLEVSANRDSISFADVYGIEDSVETMFRGTLRFEGWCKLMFGFTKLGLLDTAHAARQGQTWEELLSGLAEKRGYGSTRDLLLNDLTHDEADRVLAALDWLGASGELPLGSENANAAFVNLLSDKLSLQPGERDLVLMRHDLKFKWPNGEERETNSSLIAFGEHDTTAMAKTVGLTAAIGANLILEGHLDDKCGLASPMMKEVFIPALERLEEEGITFNESTKLIK